jgi:hypothetical protein
MESTRFLLGRLFLLSIPDLIRDPGRGTTVHSDIIFLVIARLENLPEAI